MVARAHLRRKMRFVPRWPPVRVFWLSMEATVRAGGHLRIHRREHTTHLQTGGTLAGGFDLGRGWLVPRKRGFAPELRGGFHATSASFLSTARILGPAERFTVSSPGKPYPGSSRRRDGAGGCGPARATHRDASGAPVPSGWDHENRPARFQCRRAAWISGPDQRRSPVCSTVAGDEAHFSEARHGWTRSEPRHLIR
jgi:hypothetical protein